MNKLIPTKEYNFILKNIPILCVDIAIVKVEKTKLNVLLVKRKTEPCKDSWWLPGGRVLKGEKLIECAKRKCIEEVGLDCDISIIVHTDETIFDTGPHGIAVHSINFCFMATAKTFDVKLDKYSIDFKWVSKIENSFHPYVKKCLEGCGIK